MIVVHAYPPNIDEIVQSIGNGAKAPGIVYTYGNTIYAPTATKPLHPSLYAHEEAHMEQQAADPAGWWARYLKDPQFRLDQEVVAYRRQVAFLNTCPRKERRTWTRFIVKSLASPIYGNLVNAREARALLGVMK